MTHDPAATVLRLHNTLTGRTEPFVPADPARITFYSCGPTVYDDAHIGNFRSFLAADVLRRWLESPLCTLATADGGVHHGPRSVVHVMNITDVGHMTDDSAADGGGEDKMALAGRRIEEAKKAGKLPAGVDVDPRDPRAIAAFYTDRFVEDAKRLGLKVASDADADPALMPRASAHVEPGMIPMIASLIERGHAYVRGEPGSRAVYFDVQSFPAYGALSGNTLEHLRGGAGGRVSGANQAQKKHPADFLLWKEDASHIMKWPSPWGEGYPGWHIECSAMARALLGEVIDLHSGGEDNIFPHHECEIAQSCCATGHHRFARHWFHARFLMVEGKKMSKSAGTFYTARDLFAQGHDPAAVRLELIKGHYRANTDFSLEGLRASAKTVERWRAFRQTATGSPERAAGAEPRGRAREAFAAAMHDDLNLAGAIGAINAWMNDTQHPSPADAALLGEFDAVLGLLDLGQLASTEFSIGVFLPGVAPSPAVEALLADRAAARKAKDFARSDAIRDELKALGYAIKDVAGGRVEVGPA